MFSLCFTIQSCSVSGRVKMREIFVQNAYDGKSVLVTGATGFLGKVLVEKLLRDCREIDTIYVLLRGKKGIELQKYFEKFKELLVFKKVKEVFPEGMNKLVAIEGDLMVSPCAGISNEDIQLLTANVNFVFHCAASVRFDEPLKNAIQMNTIGTRNMLDLAEKFNNLDGFIHVSTAFSNTNQSIVREIVYEPIYDYKTVIAACEMDSEGLIEEIRETALNIFPNTYIFSKNLAEKLVIDRTNIPVVIVRPSVICPSYKEPMPGWVDSINGPMGVLLGASSGILRTVHGNPKVVPDLIPVDFTVNLIIAAGASLAQSDVKEAKVYNCTSSKQMPITWKEFLDLSKEIYLHYPSTKVLWYPGGRMCSNYFAYMLYFTLFQFIPACLIDLSLTIAGRKTWAIKLQRKIFTSLKVFEYFLKQQWNWENQNMMLLFKQMSLKDRYELKLSIQRQNSKQI